MNSTVAVTGQRAAADVGGERAREAAQRPTLGKYYADGRAAAGESLDEPPCREERIRCSWRWRELLWQVSSLERVRKCGRVPHGAGGAVLRLSEGSAGYAGLVRCGSPWSCLGGCRRRIAARWAGRVGDLLRAVDDVGHGATLATFTVRHHAGQRLAWLLDQLADSWSQLLRNRPGRRVLERFGVQGQIRVIEITHGDACGWHPHYHVLFVHDTPLSAEMARTFGEQLFDVWVSYLQKRGLTAIEHRGGMDCRPIDLGNGTDVAEYLNKVGFEVAGEHLKVARRVENMTPEQLFAEFAVTGNVAYLELWEEYEQATHGRQRISPAKELFRRYGVAEVESDQEIVNEDAGGDEVIALPAETWRALAGPLAGELQIIAEQGGRYAAAAWLTGRGLEWSWATPAPRLPRPPRPASGRHDQPGRPGGHNREGHDVGKGMRLRRFGRRPRTVGDVFGAALRLPPIEEDADLFGADPRIKTAHCPVDDHCAGCGVTDGLTVGLSIFGPGRVACATVCQNCQGRSFLRLAEVGFAGLEARIAAHGTHTGF